MVFYNSITMGAVTQFKYDITSANLPLMQFLLHTNHECPIFLQHQVLFQASLRLLPPTMRDDVS